MCGFIGVFDPACRGPVSAARLSRLLPFLRHRGPDQEALLVRDGFGIASCRLAVRGGRVGDQPCVSADGDTVVAFNGELFGWPADQADVRAFLDAPTAARLPGLSRGMGAVACYRGAAQELILDVDPLGIKPLYRAFDAEGRIWFASELKPLLLAMPALRRVDPRGLSELLHFQRPGAALPFAGVARVVDRVVHRAGPARRPEDAPTSVSAPEPRASGFPRAVPGQRSPQAAPSPRGPVPAQVREAWQAAAVEAGRVEGPLSLFLSGGLDSAAVAAWCGRDDILCLTGRFDPPGGALDESAFAADVAAQVGLRHEVVDLRDADLISDLPEVVRALEVPMMGPGSLALWRMAKRARAHGKVVLTGTGGDELFGGYARTALALGRAGPWTRGYEALSARIEAAGTEPEARLRAAFSRFSDLQPVLDAGFLHSLPAPAPLHGPLPDAGPDAACDALLEAEREGTLRGLLHIEDRVLSAHGLEGRPVACLGDLRALAGRLPRAWLVGPDGEGKRALRAALAGHIPEHVRVHPRKRGFPTPFARAARGPGRAFVLDLMHDRRFIERGWWRVEACRALLDADRPVHDRALFAVCTWEIWARLFLDGDAFPEPCAPPAAVRSAPAAFPRSVAAPCAPPRPMPTSPASTRPGTPETR